MTQPTAHATGPSSATAPVTAVQSSPVPAPTASAQTVPALRVRDLRKTYDNKVQALKPHLGTAPRVFYAGIDKEVR